LGLFNEIAGTSGTGQLSLLGRHSGLEQEAQYASGLDPSWYQSAKMSGDGDEFPKSERVSTTQMFAGCWRRGRKWVGDEPGRRSRSKSSVLGFLARLTNSASVGAGLWMLTNISFRKKSEKSGKMDCLSKKSDEAKQLLKQGAIHLGAAIHESRASAWNGRRLGSWHLKTLSEISMVIEKTLVDAPVIFAGFQGYTSSSEALSFIFQHPEGLR
jgi:hypothetical protein